MRKKIYAEFLGEGKGHILYVEYRLFGLLLYKKEKHVKGLVDYSDF